MSMVVRIDEWMAGEINHAIYLDTMCESSAGIVFPAPGPGTALTCEYVFEMNLTKQFPFCLPPGIGPRPKHGALFFLDYTDEQIESMELPAWHKPMVTAMAHYGGYVGDTFGSNMGSLPARIEGADVRHTLPCKIVTIIYLYTVCFLRGGVFIYIGLCNSWN